VLRGHGTGSLVVVPDVKVLGYVMLSLSTRYSLRFTFPVSRQSKSDLLLPFLSCLPCRNVVTSQFWSGTPQAWAAVVLPVRHHMYKSYVEFLCLFVCVKTTDLGLPASQRPTETFFGEKFGLPLTMNPNFEDLSCEMIFGQVPPPIEQDAVYNQVIPCLRPPSQQPQLMRDECDSVDGARTHGFQGEARSLNPVRPGDCRAGGHVP
jgi:hypothetical protein